MGRRGCLQAQSSQRTSKVLPTSVLSLLTLLFVLPAFLRASFFSPAGFSDGLSLLQCKREENARGAVFWFGKRIQSRPQRVTFCRWTLYRLPCAAGWVKRSRRGEGLRTVDYSVVGRTDVTTQEETAAHREEKHAVVCHPQHRPVTQCD